MLIFFYGEISYSKHDRKMPLTSEQALIKSFPNIYIEKRKTKDAYSTDMKLRCGKQTLDKTIALESKTGSFKSKRSVKTAMMKKKGRKLYETVTLADSETNSSSVNKDHDNLRFGQQKFLLPNNVIVDAVNPTNKHLSQTSITVPSSSNVGETVQDNSPLVVDVTNLLSNNAKIRGRTHSIVNSIINQESDCIEMIQEVTKLPVKKTRNLKRKNSDRSVETLSRNVKIKLNGVLPELNQNVKPVDDDTCSVISVGSDEEVIVLDNTTKSNMDVSNSSDVVVLDTTPCKRMVTSDDVVVDLCTPVIQSTKSTPDILNSTKKRNSRKNKGKKSPCKFGNSPFKEYVSVLDNLPQTSETTVNGVRGISARLSCALSQGITPLPPSDRVTATATNVNCGTNENIHCAIIETSSKNSASTVEHNQWNSTRVQSSSLYGSNLYNPNPSFVRTGLRPVVIDGSNVAMGHTNGRFFSCRGLQICIDYFVRCNHKVIAFVPQFRKSSYHSSDTHILDRLEKQGYISFTPSRRIRDRLVVPYDDRYIVQYAAESGGVIVSTDNYRDLLQENPAWRETIEKRLLMFTWVGDVLMFPQDPLGRSGPNLERFLRFP